MENKLDRAIQLATMWHEGQIDKAGFPYIEHPLRVMASVESIETKIIAVLHDVIEDCGVTINDLVENGIPLDLATCVSLLSRTKSEPYMDYIERVASDVRTRQVKLADLKDNMDLTRLYPTIDVTRLEDASYLKETLSEKDLRRYKKYQKAKQRLETSFR